jgi:hypothetical protein
MLRDRDCTGRTLDRLVGRLLLTGYPQLGFNQDVVQPGFFISRKTLEQEFYSDSEDDEMGAEA